MFTTPKSKNSFGTSRVSIQKGNLSQFLLQARGFKSRKSSIEKAGKFYMSGDAQYHHTNINSKLIIPQVMMVYDSLDSLPLEQSQEESFEPIVKQLMRDTGKFRENPLHKATLP